MPVVLNTIIITEKNVILGVKEALKWRTVLIQFLFYLLDTFIGITRLERTFNTVFNISIYVEEKCVFC